MPEQRSYIDKVKLPSGNIYYLKDAEAREMISHRWEYHICTSASDTPYGITWMSGSTEITGTLVASENTEYVFYLVARNNDTDDYYDEYGTVKTGTSPNYTYAWELLGSTKVVIDNFGNFAFADTGTVTIKPKGTNSSSSVTFTGGTTDKVLGKDTTFTNASSAVTFGNHTTATVLTDQVTATVPKTSATTKYLTASASGTAVGVATSSSALTGLGTPTTDTFVKSYPGATSKLSTTTVTGVSGSTTASKAAAGTAVNVATTDTAKTCATGAFTNDTPVTAAAGVVVADMHMDTIDPEMLVFSFKKLATTSVTPAKSNGTITPYTFTDVTVPKAASSATTVATGSVAANGSGATVMTGLGTAVTADSITALGTPTSDTFAKTVSVTTQPTITLTANDSNVTGSVKYVQQIGTSGTNSVTFDTTTSDHTAQAITALGTATAAAQTITVGTNDIVDAVTSIGTGTAAAQTFTGTQETYTVNPVPKNNS